MSVCPLLNICIYYNNINIVNNLTEFLTKVSISKYFHNSKTNFT